MSAKEKERQDIEMLRRVNDLAADAEDVFYDIAGKDLGWRDEIRTLIASIRATLDVMVKSRAEERHYQ